MGRVVSNPLALGFYTVPEAARLIAVGRTNRIYGWLRGYADRKSGPLLTRDYQPIGDNEELSFLDLMEVRFVEHFREHGVKARSLRLAAEQLRAEFKTDHPFALDKVHVTADKADVFVLEVFRESAAKAGDQRLRSLTTNNYVMYEALKQSLLPGVQFHPSTHLAERWVPRPKDFPRIVIDPGIAYGHPAGPSRVPTATLYDAWKAEDENSDAVAYWYRMPTTEVMEAVRFERHLERRQEARAA
jgi:uncharacterized protein (DUF433 family)